MESRDLIESFNNLYSISKTLRFGLKPIHETEEHIVNGLIFPSKENGNKIDDKTRAKHGTIVKQMLNEMHRNFIAEALSTKNVKEYFSENEEAKKAKKAIKNCYEKWKKSEDISKEQTILIGGLKKIFGDTAAGWKKDYETYENNKSKKPKNNKSKTSILYNGKETPKLLEWQIETEKIKLAKEEEKGHYYSKDEMLKFLHSFKKFSGYFTGFNKNRENVYSFGDKEKKLISTSIAHRLFERNIKIHFENIKKWETVKKSLKEGEVEIEKAKPDKEKKKISAVLKEKAVDYEKLLKSITLTGKTEEAEINLEKELEHFFSPEAFLEYLSYDAIENEYNLVIGGLPAQTTKEKPRGINEIINTEIRQKAHAKRHQFPVLEPLHKQILSKKTAFIDEFNSIEEMLKAIRSFHEQLIIDTGMEHETIEEEKIKKESIVTAWAELSKSKILENVPKKLNKDHVNKIKAYLDSCKDYLDSCNEHLKKFPVIDLYNKCRNFITKKDYQESKFKLTFQNPTLAAGWDRNKEKVSRCVILRKDNVYYLGIMNGKYNTLFEECNKQFEENTVGQQTSNGDKVLQESGTYQKMIYKQIPNAGRGIQNLMVIDGKTCRKTGRIHTSGRYAGQNPELEEDKNKNLPEKINEIRKRKSYLKTNNNFNQKDLIQFINYYKERAREYEYWKFPFRFKFKPAEQYKDFSEFTDHLGLQGYSITFKNISRTCIDIDECVKEGKLFLFQIYNKDLLAQKTGKSPNLHTLYWKALFDEENLKDVVIKLSGQAELFMREKSIAAPFVHKKEFVLKHKKHARHWEELELPISGPTAWKDVKIKKGITTEKTTIGEHVYEHIMYKGDRIGRIIQNEAQEITKDKRYTENQYFFHVPIELNFKAPKPKSSFISNRVNSFLANNSDIKIIGIDRGERHLLYYSVIDQNGKIEEQGTLNIIGEGNKAKNYHDLLDQREKERDKARKEWQSIEKIKDLKAGYLSQVVHKITQLIEKYNAIVVLEDLNVGFKRGRQKIEKEIYQRFEKALIDKLNYLVFKDRPARDPGGYLNAAQLTDIESFEKMGKQNGILFYTVASYTSQTDPVTGFCRSLYPEYKNVKSAQEFWESFDDIRYNKSDKRFEFTFTEGSDENDTTNGQKKTWTICSNVIRSRYIKRSKDDEATKQDTDAASIGRRGHHETFLVNNELERLFKDEGIDYQNASSLKDILCQTDNSKFHNKLICYFNAILSMRVTDDQESSDKRDFILSPVEPFFDSRNENRYLPVNSDANGAYNIARKGICILKRIPYIEKLKELLEEAEIKRTQMKLASNSIRTTLALIKDSAIQNEIKALAEKWLKEEKRETRPFDFSGHLFKKSEKNTKLSPDNPEWAASEFKKSGKNTKLSPDEELFLDFFDISISKRRWQDYCQSESVVRKQIELTQ